MHEEDGKCCYRALSGACDDFKAQSSLLQEHGKDVGYEVRFLPKFHPELNPIEKLWHFSKTRLREGSCKRGTKH